MTEIKLTTGVWEYDETQPLGRPGGFGQVFKGSSKDFPAVAIKRLHLTAAAAAHRELQIAGSLLGRPSNHVIRFLDVGEDADSGGYFIVMAKADYSLEDEIARGVTFDAASVANILMQAAMGLQEAGDVVHRDMKPGNLLFHEGKWKVADFGIARFIDEATASNTLKGYLSRDCAAPEQWRFEHATSATDIYALGCIGYWLLNSSPPFVSNPQQEHQFSPVPSFSCADSRLSSLINMMLRKVPATRPSLSRVISQLAGIDSQPAGIQSSAVNMLAAAGAQVAAQEQADQAAEQTLRTLSQNRKQLLSHGFDVLRQSANGLWEKVLASAPAAQKSTNDRQRFSCSLGQGSLVVNFANSSNVLEEKMFPHSKWDMIGAAQILVTQNNPKFVWPSTLWYAKRPGTDDYRWYEISFFTPLSGYFGLVEVTNPKDADFALSNVMHSVAVAYGPKLIDDEDESDFHGRYLRHLARAATGQLSFPSTLPIGSWPS
jgi:serine/threonine-protein kinase